MAQKCLDHANIDILLEEVRGETVLQRVRRHALLDPGGLGGGTDGAAKLTGRQRLDRVAAGNSQPRSTSRLRRRPSRHQARSSSSSCGDNIA